MEELLPLLETVALFRRMSREEILELLRHLSAKTVRFAKDQPVFLAGDPVSSVGIVCQGGVQVVLDDTWGNRTIQALLGPGELFGESFVCSNVGQLPVGVVADRDSLILLIRLRDVLERPPAFPFHFRLLENLLSILADKNVLLSRRAEILSKRTTREKLLTFLAIQSQNAGSRRLSIPLSRQELADYLCVDRSALSTVLGKLQREGLLRYHRSRFELLGG